MALARLKMTETLHHLSNNRKSNRNKLVRQLTHTRWFSNGWKASTKLKSKTTKAIHRMLRTRPILARKSHLRTTKNLCINWRKRRTLRRLDERIHALWLTRGQSKSLNSWDMSLSKTRKEVKLASFFCDMFWTDSHSKINQLFDRNDSQPYFKFLLFFWERA